MRDDFPDTHRKKRTHTRVCRCSTSATHYAREGQDKFRSEGWGRGTQERYTYSLIPNKWTDDQINRKNTHAFRSSTNNTPIARTCFQNTYNSEVRQTSEQTQPQNSAEDTHTLLTYNRQNNATRPGFNSSPSCLSTNTYCYCCSADRCFLSPPACCVSATHNNARADWIIPPDRTVGESLLVPIGSFLLTAR